MLSLICDGLPPSTGAVLVSPHLRPSRIRSVLLVGESDGLHLCLVDVLAESHDACTGTTRETAMVWSPDSAHVFKQPDAGWLDIVLRGWSALSTSGSARFPCDICKIRNLQRNLLHVPHLPLFGDALGVFFNLHMMLVCIFQGLHQRFLPVCQMLCKHWPCQLQPATAVSEYSRRLRISDESQYSPEIYARGVHILQKLRLDKRWIKEFSADVK